MRMEFPIDLKSGYLDKLRLLFSCQQGSFTKRCFPTEGNVLRKGCFPVERCCSVKLSLIVSGDTPTPSSAFSASTSTRAAQPYIHLYSLKLNK